MNKLTLYFTFLITSMLSPNLLAQYPAVKNINWTIASNIPTAIGLAGAIIGVDNQVLLIAGGTNFPGEMPWDGGKKRYYNDIFLYQKTPHHLSLVPTKNGLKLPINLAYSAVCSTSHGIVVAGGENENGLSKNVFLLNYKENELTINTLPDLPNGLTNAALTVIGDVVYLAGGEIASGTTTQFLSLNLKTAKGWIKLVNLPKPVSHTVLLARQNQKEIFLVGGRKKNVGDTSTLYKEIYAFDTAKQIWSLKGNLPYPLSAASGVSIDANLLIFSGDKGETFHQVEKLIAAIDAEKDVMKKEILNQQKIALQSNHPGFSRAVLKYDLMANTWAELENILPYGTVTTHAVVLNNEVMIAGGEIRAGVRTPQIMLGNLK